jgi:hypothetical protein
MITAAQMRAARAVFGLGKKHHTELAGVCVPTVLRM